MVKEPKKFKGNVEEARRESRYYKRIAEETGRTRLREIKQLSRLINEFRRAKEEVKHSEEKYRVLVENSPIGIYYSDFQGRSLYGNKKAEEVWVCIHIFSA
jgi:PAS domain-containing protein